MSFITALMRQYARTVLRPPQELLESCTHVSSAAFVGVGGLYKP
jgi:hypothetical protein